MISIISARYINFVLMVMTLCLIQTSYSSVPNGYDITSKYENIALKASYTMQPAPNYPNCKNGFESTKLTDGVYSNGLKMFWTQPTTVGWMISRPVTITIDLGSDQPIRGASYNTAANQDDVYWPTTISILVSNDGNDFIPVGDLIKLNLNAHRAPPDKSYSYRFWTDELKTHGRYIQLIVDTNDGVSNCVFSDEIEVYRGKQTRAMTPYPTTGKRSKEFFDQMIVNNSFQSHLMANLKSAHEELNSAKLPVSDSKALLGTCDTLQSQIEKLPDVELTTYKTLLPLNDIDTQIYALRGQIRAKQHKSPLQAWVCNPYAYLTPTQGPDAKSAASVQIAMMNGEWRSGVVNLTNNTGLPVKLHIKVQGMPTDAGTDFLSISQVLWHDSTLNVPVARGLEPITTGADGAEIIIPAGMLKQVWFTVHPTSLAAKTYNARVDITGENYHGVVPLSLQIFSSQFPKQPTLHLYGWDYSNYFIYGVTAQNQAAFIAMLQSHFVDSPWSINKVLPFGNFNKDNTMKDANTADFDNWVKLWKGSARRYCVFLNPPDILNGAKINTPDFSARVTSWINFWTTHLAAQGLSPEQLVLMIADEPRSTEAYARITSWACAINAAQPKVTIFQDVNINSPQNISTAMQSAVDVFCLDRGRSVYFSGKFQNTDFFRNQRKIGKQMEIYDTKGPIDTLDPYSYSRLQAWLCWSVDASGMGFWSFSSLPKGTAWQNYSVKDINYVPFILEPDTVMPAKQMEAIREGVEDYEYMVMLKKAIAAAKPNHPEIAHAQTLLTDGVNKVLNSTGVDNIKWNQVNDYDAADKLRLEILQSLEKLQK
ncbi:MAG: discoidin domain-containing protein [bacterium]